MTARSPNRSFDTKNNNFKTLISIRSHVAIMHGYTLEQISKIQVTCSWCGEFFKVLCTTIHTCVCVKYTIFTQKTLGSNKLPTGQIACWETLRYSTASEWLTRALLKWESRWLTRSLFKMILSWPMARVIHFSLVPTGVSGTRTGYIVYRKVMLYCLCFYTPMLK